MKHRGLLVAVAALAAVAAMPPAVPAEEALKGDPYKPKRRYRRSGASPAKKLLAQQQERNKK